ncbi:MAG: hypothetical protein IBX45_10665 [Campylobacterales bacterium]|nr:hypothetical protein [Campylobacterales bacterium]
MALWCLALPLYAHKLSIFLKEDAGKVEMRAYFSKSAPCKGCAVEVRDASGKTLMQTRTDDEGNAQLTLPKGATRLVVDGGMGHHQEVALEQVVSEEEPAPLAFLLSLLGIGVFFGLLWYVKRPK